jgi:integration host factor subunit beta
MTKSDLIEHVAQLKKVSKGRAEVLVNKIFDCLEEALRRDERVEIRGLGSFETRRYGAYKGRNPRTGASVAVKPKRLPFFKAGKELKDLINSNLIRTQEMPAIGSPSKALPNAKTEKNDPAPVPSASSHSR